MHRPMEGRDPYGYTMTTVTLSSKGQLTIPRNLRDHLGLTAGSRLQVSVDRADPSIPICWCG